MDILFQQELGLVDAADVLSSSLPWEVDNYSVCDSNYVAEFQSTLAFLQRCATMWTWRSSWRSIHLTTKWSTASGRTSAVEPRRNPDLRDTVSKAILLAGRRHSGHWTRWKGDQWSSFRFTIFNWNKHVWGRQSSLKSIRCGILTNIHPSPYMFTTLCSVIW